MTAESIHSGSSMSTTHTAKSCIWKCWY